MELETLPKELMEGTADLPDEYTVDIWDGPEPEQIQVLILFDETEHAFSVSALRLAFVYERAGAKVLRHQANENGLQLLKKVISTNKRVLVHYIGHGQNSGSSTRPKFQVFQWVGLTPVVFYCRQSL